MVKPVAPHVVAAWTGPTPGDGFLRHWQLWTASVIFWVCDAALNVPTGVQGIYATMPAAGDAWRTIAAEVKGLVNLSDEIGSAKNLAVISVAWAKTDVVSDTARTKTAWIGWVREIWVDVSGVLAYAKRDLGDLPAAQVAG